MRLFIRTTTALTNSYIAISSHPSLFSYKKQLPIRKWSSATSRLVYPPYRCLYWSITFLYYSTDRPYCSSIIRTSPSRVLALRSPSKISLTGTLLEPFYVFFISSSRIPIANSKLQIAMSLSSSTYCSGYPATSF